MRGFKLSLLAFVLAASAASGGCVPLIVGAGGAAAVGASQERGIDAALDDNKIGIEINRRLVEKDADLYNRTSTLISKGRVMLIGYVANERDKQTAARIAGGVPGVLTLHDELRIGKDTSFSESANDSLIASKLRGRLIGDGKIDSVNYSIKTVRGTVYLMGIAQDQAELSRVISQARSVSGVRDIVSHVEIKS